MKSAILVHMLVAHVNNTLTATKSHKLLPGTNQDDMGAIKHNRIIRVCFKRKNKTSLEWIGCLILDKTLNYVESYYDATSAATGVDLEDIKYIFEATKAIDSKLNEMKLRAITEKF
jgi:hypothetical protein